MKSGLVKVSDGAHIYYEIEGSGRPVVLIHGWGCSGQIKVVIIRETRAVDYAK